MSDAIFFWITNISNRNVSLADLNVTVKANASINLLDSKHYKFNLNQLEKSVLSGSIYKKRDKIIVRKVPPEIKIKKSILIDRDTTIPSRERSILSIKQEKYEELLVSDEEYAKNNADLADLDSKPHTTGQKV